MLQGAAGLLSRMKNEASEQTFAVHLLAVAGAAPGGTRALAGVAPRPVAGD